MFRGRKRKLPRSFVPERYYFDSDSDQSELWAQHVNLPDAQQPRREHYPPSGQRPCQALPRQHHDQHQGMEPQPDEPHQAHEAHIRVLDDDTEDESVSEVEANHVQHGVQLLQQDHNPPSGEALQRDVQPHLGQESPLSVEEHQQDPSGGALQRGAEQHLGRQQSGGPLPQQDVRVRSEIRVRFGDRHRYQQQQQQQQQNPGEHEAYILELEDYVAPPGEDEGAHEEDDVDFALQDGELDYQTILNDLADKWMVTKLEHTVSKVASNQF